MPATYEPTAMTFEVWFKADDIATVNLEVIVGMSPYKLRKKSSSSEIQINYQGTLSYCDTNSTLKSNTWYYFAMTLSEKTLTMACYLN